MMIKVVVVAGGACFAVGMSQLPNIVVLVTKSIRMIDITAALSINSKLS